MTVLLPFVIILVLVLINGLFVAAEFSIIGVRPSRIEQLSAKGNQAARWVRSVLASNRRTDNYIATAQLGITLASLGLGMYAEPAIAHLIEEPLHDWLGLEGPIVHTISFIIALGMVTYLHVVVGEMVPKSLALQKTEQTVLWLSMPMRVVSKVMALPVVALNRIGLLTLKLLRVPPPGQGSRLYSLDELEMLVEESAAGGLLTEREQELVGRLFDFAEERVEVAMIPRTQMTAIPLTIEQDELLDLFPQTPYSRLPVYGENIDDVIGVLHLKDLVRQQLSGEPFDLQPLLRQVPYVPENLPVKALLASFKRQHHQMAIVIDEHGGTLGLVTLEDLLEEVVGEVHDEFDVDEEVPVTVVEPGHLLVQGRVHLEDLQAYIPAGSHEHDVHTLGGLVWAELGRRPKVGDEIELGLLTLRVDSVEGLSIQTVSIFFSPEFFPSRGDKTG